MMDLIYFYMIVAAFFLGKFETEDFYRGRNGTPRGIGINLLLALCWPAVVAVAFAR